MSKYLYLLEKYKRKNCLRQFLYNIKYIFDKYLKYCAGQFLGYIVTRKTQNLEKDERAEKVNNK